MTDMIVQTHTILTLLGASPTQISHVKQAVNDSVILVAADGGASTSLACGRIPDAVIGDMDSITPEIREEIPHERLFHIAEQDSTDFEKCLMRVSAGAIVAYGFLGGRVDHELAAFTSLVRNPHHRCILVGEEDIVFLSSSTFEIDLPEGTRFSLYPLAPVKGTSQGLLYPIDGLSLSPVTQVGTSNEVTGPVRLSFESREMLIILPAEHLDAALTAIAPNVEMPAKSPLAPRDQ